MIPFLYKFSVYDPSVFDKFTAFNNKNTYWAETDLGILLKLLTGLPVFNNDFSKIIYAKSKRMRILKL